VLHVLLLLILWLLAWGDLSVANVLTGVVLAIALLVAYPPSRSAWRIRPLGLVRLLVYVLAQLVPSNILVTREIARPRSQVRTGVIAHAVADASDELLALISNVIALTPGTMTVEATPDPPVIYVHFLRLDDVDRARRDLVRLEALCRAALRGPPPRPSPGGVAVPEEAS
jgi:multicomponent Na+:H+ antiporter subunit E